MIPTIKLTILQDGYKIGVLELPSSIANEYMPSFNTLIPLNDIPVYYSTITKKVIGNNPLVRLVYID